MKFKIKNCLVKKIYRTEYNDFVNRDALLEDEFGDLIVVSLPRKVKLSKGDTIDSAIGEIVSNGNEVADKNGNIRVFNNVKLISIRSGNVSDADDKPASVPAKSKPKAKPVEAVDADDEDEDLFL